MADSITLNSMSGGSVVDTEVPSFRGNHIQRMKIAVGAVDSDAGDATSTNPLPVLIANTTVSGTTTTISGSKTDVQNFPTYQSVQLRDAGGNMLGIPTSPVTVSGIISANVLVPKRAGIAASSSGDNTIISAPTNGQRIYVYAFEISFSGTVNAKFTDGASGTLLGGLYYGVANAGAANSVAPNPETNPPAPVLWIGSPNTALILNLSGAVAVGGGVSYYVM